MDTSANTPLNGQIEITAPDHIFQCAEMFALRAAISEVKALELRIAGVGVALAVMEKCDAENRARAMARNLRAAAKAGAALSDVSVQVRVEDGRLFIEWTHEEPQS